MIRRRSPTYYIDGGIVKQTFPFNGTTSNGVYGFDEVVGGGVEEKKEDCDSVRTSALSHSSVEQQQQEQRQRQPQQPIDLLLENNVTTSSVIRPSILLAAPARSVSPQVNTFQSNPQQQQQQQQVLAQHQQQQQSPFLTPPSSLSNVRQPNTYVHQSPYDDVFYGIDEKNDDEFDDPVRTYNRNNRPLDEQVRDNSPAGIGRMMNDGNSPKRDRIGLGVERIAEVLFNTCCDNLCFGTGDKEQQTMDDGNYYRKTPLCTNDCLMHPEDWIFRLCTKDDSKYSKAPLSIAEELRKVGKVGERQRSGGVGSGGNGGGGSGPHQQQRPRSPRPTSPGGVNRQQPVHQQQLQQQQFHHHQQQHFEQEQQHAAPVYNYRPDIPRYLAEQAVNSFEEDDNISAISQHTIDELTRQGIRHHPRILRRIPTSDDVWASTAEGSGISEDHHNTLLGVTGSSSSTNNLQQLQQQQQQQQQASNNNGPLLQNNGRRSTQTARGIGKWKQQQQQQQIMMNNSSSNPMTADDDILLFGRSMNVDDSNATRNHTTSVNRGMMHHHHNYYVPQSVPESNMEDSI